MAKNKLIILPDKIFHTLWDTACDCNSFDEYYNSIIFTNSYKYIDFSRYNIPLDQVYDLLKSIYQASSLTIKDLLSKYNYSKAAFSHRFCVPIRTVENWCASTNKCPNYTRLLFLQSLGEPILPSYIVTGSMVTKATTEAPIKKKSAPKKSIVTEKSSYSNDFSNNLYDTDYTNSHFSLRDWEQTHTNSSSSNLLSKTDYLSDILKRRSRQNGDDG